MVRVRNHSRKVNRTRRKNHSRNNKYKKKSRKINSLKKHTRRVKKKLNGNRSRRVRYSKMSNKIQGGMNCCMPPPRSSKSKRRTICSRPEPEILPPPEPEILPPPEPEILPSSASLEPSKGSTPALIPTNLMERVFGSAADHLDGDCKSQIESEVGKLLETSWMDDKKREYATIMVNRSIGEKYPEEIKSPYIITKDLGSKEALKSYQDTEISRLRSYLDTELSSALYYFTNISGLNKMITQLRSYADSGNYSAILEIAERGDWRSVFKKEIKKLKEIIKKKEITYSDLLTIEEIIIKLSYYMVDDD